MATCLPFGTIPFKPHSPRPAKITCSSTTAQSQLAKQHLLSLISDQDRGLKTQNNPLKLTSIVSAIDDLAALGKDSITTGGSLSATWRLLWTTEKEQLFIIQNASLFGTLTGDVLQMGSSSSALISPSLQSRESILNLQVRFYEGRIGRFHCHRLGRVGLTLCTLMMRFELRKCLLLTSLLLLVRHNTDETC
ncbi:PREDICTED: probable plastid-lipid-associated [Prunus dulcis]|uniref:PREDICTED: probable plastid-lipid-associated n=1 Tax=Prunus dulcis TaxID=3755 RepID=A0A5E4GE11_PRUDU|nr:PREDICTED: probable plastid-lipid-associated [Prunus dulcis]